MDGLDIVFRTLDRLMYMARGYILLQEIFCSKMFVLVSNLGIILTTM